MPCSTGLPLPCQTDVPLREHTWYGLGGPARWFFTPENDDQLADILHHCRQEGIEWRVLGGGANVLVRDEGFPGAVIKLAGPNFSWFEHRRNSPPWKGGAGGGSKASDFARQSKFTYFDHRDGLIRAGAGVDMTKLVKFASDNGLGGLECLAGIPGTVGGGIRMNAGGKYGSISQFVVDVTLVDADGRPDTRPAGQVGFRYRHSDLAGCIVVGATLRCEPGDPAKSRERFKAIWTEKHATQPPVSERTAGCIFKNPRAQLVASQSRADQSRARQEAEAAASLSAGALVDRAGLKGHRVGGAEISPRHANFIVAHPDARAADILALIEIAQARVFEQFGVQLELEVDVW